MSLPASLIECGRCNQALPVTMFPRFPRDKRCGHCLRQVQMEREEQAKQGLLKRHLGQMYADMRRKELDLMSVTDFCNGMIQAFGGPQQFFQSLYEEIQHAKKNKPGSRTAIDAHTMIAKLHVKANEMDAPAQLPELLKDGDLEAEIAKHLVNLMPPEALDELSDEELEEATKDDA